MLMQAAVFEAAHEPLKLQELTIADPGPGEVRVRLHASGVCHSDYHVMIGEWAAPSPLVLGHEGAGVVEAVGEAVSTVSVGDHVILSWTPTCRRCRYCVAGRPALCEVAAETAYSSVMPDGSTRLSRGSEAVHSFLSVGSFGEFTIVPESAAVPIRRDAPLDRASIVGCAVTTGIGAALNTVQVRPGDSVLVIGCGGVGLSTIMGAKLASARTIIAVDVVASKLDLARRVGATETVDARELDVLATIREITGGLGVDFAFEAIGNPRTIEQAYDATAPGGTAVVVGQVADGVKIQIDPYIMSDREKTLTGSNYGSSRVSLDFPSIVDLYMAGGIDLDALVSETIPLERVGDAFDAMSKGQTARSIIVYP